MEAGTPMLEGSEEARMAAEAAPPASPEDGSSAAASPAPAGAPLEQAEGSPGGQPGLGSSTSVAANGPIGAVVAAPTAREDHDVAEVSSPSSPGAAGGPEKKDGDIGADGEQRPPAATTPKKDGKSQEKASPALTDSPETVEINKKGAEAFAGPSQEQLLEQFMDDEYMNPDGKPR